MKLGGLQKTSLLDYPDKLSAILWTIGCNFHCPFCYNVHLVEGTVTPLPEEEVLEFLIKRKHQLDGVVLTGGEPLLQADILSFTKKLKDMKYLIKIDTNGSCPAVLSDLLDGKLVDYVAMDIKAPQEKYPELTGMITDLTAIQQSIELLLNSDVEYEFRTTVIPNMLTKEDIISIAKWIEGAEKYCLQQFKKDTSLLLPSMEEVTPYSKKEMVAMMEEVQPYIKTVELRGI